MASINYGDREKEAHGVWQRMTTGTCLVTIMSVPEEDWCQYQDNYWSLYMGDNITCASPGQTPDTRQYPGQVNCNILQTEICSIWHDWRWGLNEMWWVSVNTGSQVANWNANIGLKTKWWIDQEIHVENFWHDVQKRNFFGPVLDLTKNEDVFPFFKSKIIFLIEKRNCRS